jgi:hypothetical protein
MYIIDSGIFQVAVYLLPAVLYSLYSYTTLLIYNTEYITFANAITSCHIVPLLPMRHQGTDVILCYLLLKKMYNLQYCSTNPLL